MDSFGKAFGDFIKFFTVKHILVTLIVVACLFVLCSPQQPADGPAKETTCNDASCPLLKTPVINIPAVVITEVSKENWSFDLPDEGWQERESDNPTLKAAEVNEEKACKVLLMKEPATDTLAQHVTGTIRGFMEHLISVDSVRALQINGNKYIAVLFNDDGNAIWVWLTVKDNFDYTFMCGCDSNAIGSKLCPDVAESLDIK